jgi:hypothetical protein
VLQWKDNWLNWRRYGRETVWVQSGYKPGSFIEKLNKTRKTLRDNSLYSFRNLNQVPMDRNLEQECPAVVEKEPQLLLWAGLRAASVKVSITREFSVICSYV